MLEQVLQQMYIDPELLDGLTELEKETLFCYMRAEQIRRWEMWDSAESSKTDKTKLQNRPSRKLGNKSVKWLTDDSGEIVVDEIRSFNLDTSEELEEFQIADKRIGLPITEVDSRSESVTSEVKNLNADEITEANEMNHPNGDVRLSIDITNLKNNDCTTSKDNCDSDTSVEEPLAINVNDTKISFSEKRLIFPEQRGVLRELSSNEVRKVAKQVAEWETRTGQHGCRVTIESTKKTKPFVKTARNNEPVEETDEQRWRSQLRKANEVEARIRNIARLAREEHRRSLIENGNETFPIFTSADNNTTVFCKSSTSWIQTSDEKDISDL